jgi:hypothetical protein
MKIPLPPPFGNIELITTISRPATKLCSESKGTNPHSDIKFILNAFTYVVTFTPRALGSAFAGGFVVNNF